MSVFSDGPRGAGVERLAGWATLRARTTRTSGGRLRHARLATASALALLAVLAAAPAASADADLTISKAGPATVAPGDTFYWTLRVSNHGPATSSGYVVDDVLPAGVTILVPAGCIGNGNVVRCTQGPQPVDTTRTISIFATAPATAGLLTNVATVTGNDADPIPDNNTATANTTVVALPPPNQAPVWAPPTPADGALFTATAGAPLTFNLGASDPDALDAVHIDATGLPAGAVVTPLDGNPAQASFAWTPSAAQVGDHSFTVTARDNRSPAASAPPRTLHVRVIAANRAPTVQTAAPDAHGDEGQTLATAGAFTDPDGDPLTLSVDSGVGTFVAHPDGTWQWSLPTNDDVAAQTITVTASDGHGNAVSDAFTYSAANDEPTVTLARDTPRAIDEGSELTYLYTFTDVGSADTIVAATTSCGSGTKVAGSDTRDAGGGSFRCVFPDGPVPGFFITVRVTDDDGGVGQSLFHVQVFNVAPTVALATANELTVDEGPAQHTYKFSISDPGQDTITAIETSCGNGGTKVAGSDTATSFACVFPDGPATSTVSVRATDSDGDAGAAGTQDVTVRNVAPTARLTGGREPAFDEGPTPRTFSFTVSDPGDDTVASSVASCGAAGTLVAGSETASSFQCVFPDGPASSTVSVRATDSDGDTGPADTQVITVRNVAPVVTISGGDTASVDESSAARTVSFSVDDPGEDTITSLTTSCGGGGTKVAGSDTASSFGCVFPDGPASSTLSVTATDSDGASGDDTQAVTVRNVAPTATLDPGNDRTVDEGAAQHTYAFSISDPGQDTVTAVVTSCGDGGTKVAGSDTPTSFACVFPDGPAAPTVSVRATDSDGDTGEAGTQAVTVRNVPPTATLDPGNVRTVDEGPAQHTYAFSVSDPGQDTVSAIVASCGTDGRLVAGSETASSFECVFPDGPASTTVSVRATDSDGDTGPADTQVVTVRNVPPTATFDAANDVVVRAGTPHTFSFTVTDPGDDTVSAIDASCGAGGTLVEGSVTATSFACVFSEAGDVTISVRATDSDGDTGPTDTQDVLVYGFPGDGRVSFVIGDTAATMNNTVTFWAAQWSRANPLSSGATAPNAFKGFAERFANGDVPRCGSTWTTGPGNSPHPPATLPKYMGVVVAGAVDKSGSTISGDVRRIVVVKPALGYAPNPGHEGRGKVIALDCG